MNATDLQKLKEMAQGALNHSDAIGEDEWYSADENMSIFAPSPDLSFIAAANPAAVLELIEIAGHAVSPAESVPISEHPEVVELRRHDHEVATRITHALMAERDEARAKVAAAHAEGRRSAMEELHPQWLKEKERADRAEADAKAWREESFMWQRRSESHNTTISMLRARLAAQQAPADPCGGCGNADPDKRCIGCGHPFAASTAQPLQQEGGKETLANGWPNDFHEVVKGAEDSAYQLGRAAGIEEAAKVCDSMHLYASFARREFAAAIRAIAQPSDNLQQASTAQAEPATVPKFAPWPDRLGNDIARGATMRYPDGSTFFVSYDDSREGTGKWRAIFPDGESLWLGNQIGTKGQAVVADPAQATPEGAELPPLQAGSMTRQEKLLALADRIDHEKLWRQPAMDRHTLTDDQQARLDAGVMLRRYADILAPGRWLVIPPTGGIQFGAGSLNAAYEMAKRDEARKASDSAAPPQQVDTNGLPG